MTQTDALNPQAAGALIKKRRQERGLTQDQLVERTGLSSQSYLSALEKGRYNVGRSEHFPAIARELHLSEADVRAINPAAVIELAPAPRFANGSPIRPVVEYADDDTLVEIPELLRRVMDRLSGTFEELKNERGVKNILPRFFDGGGPATEKEWEDWVLDNRKWIR